MSVHTKHALTPAVHAQNCADAWTHTSREKEGKSVWGKLESKHELDSHERW